MGTRSGTCHGGWGVAGTRGKCYYLLTTTGMTNLTISYDDASLPSYRPNVFVPTRTAVFTQSAFVSVSGYSMVDPEFESRQGQLFYSPDGPPNFLSNLYRTSPLVTKRPGCEVDHSPLSSSKVKNEWNSFSTPPIRLHSVIREYFAFPPLFI